MAWTTRAQNLATCQSHCGGQSLQYPLGFSEGCGVQLNCNNNQVQIGDFLVQNVTSKNIVINLPAKCNRSMQSIIPLFGDNFAPTWNNTFLMQDCAAPLDHDCFIPATPSFFKGSLESCDGRSVNISCFSLLRPNQTLDVVTYNELNRTGCNYLFSAIASGQSQSQEIQIQFQVVELEWWLQGPCQCSSNAVCTPVQGISGFRCQCDDGFRGDGFTGGIGCKRGDKHAKHHNLILIAAIISAVVFLLTLSFILTFYWMRKRSKKPSSDSLTIVQLAKVSYQNLHYGTDEFSTRNLIGSGSFGSVYKGTIEPEDTVVAIKVLNLQKKGAHKSFIAECNALKNIRHRNLVKVLTCCSSTDFKGQEFKALVLEYMTNGSLESWLHPSIDIADQSRSLKLEERLNIINDVALAVHYLHYECEQVVIHCDLKPGNVLLDDCMVAHVSDFGLARLLSNVGVSHMQSSTTRIKGTVGYVPPEYGMGSKVSIEGDTYSFGILILEMLTGRKPTDEMFKDDHNLHNYAKISLANHLLQIVDLTILTDEETATDNENLGLMHPNVENCLHSLFKIGLSCSVKSPKERMSMIDVCKELNLIKSFFPSEI